MICIRLHCATGRLCRLSLTMALGENLWLQASHSRQSAPEANKR
jgi:hypothetical protein